MLTEDQIRRGLAQVYERGGCEGCELLYGLLVDVLPDLVALASGRTDDAGRRYGEPPRLNDVQTGEAYIYGDSGWQKEERPVGGGD